MATIMLEHTADLFQVNPRAQHVVNSSVGFWKYTGPIDFFIQATCLKPGLQNQ